MHVFGLSVFTWSHRALKVAVETGARLVAGIAAVAGGGSRPAEQRPAKVTAPVVSSGSPLQPPDTGTGQACRTAATSESPGQCPAPARWAAPASVTPAMVRGWAREQGIQVADRGRIPQLVMEQYLAELTRTAAVTRRTSRGSATGPRPPSSRSRFSAA